MDAEDWDARYAAADLVWSATPNLWVEQLVAPLTPGRALDIAAGEGRNAIWLVEQGWTAVAADYSAVAVERAARLGRERLGAAADRLTAVVADATASAPGVPPAYDLVLLCYLQLPGPQRRQALVRAVEAAAPAGRILVIAHAARNLAEGYGGPQDPSVLFDPQDVVADLAGMPVTTELAQVRVRTVETAEGSRDALDTVVVLRRDGTARG